MVQPVKFTLLLMPGFSLLSLGGFLDKLRFTRDPDNLSEQEFCTWLVTTLDGLPIRASCGVEIVPEQKFLDVELTVHNCDYLVIFGGSSPAKVMEEAMQYIPLIQRYSRKKITLVSIDNAAFLFAKAGITGKCMMVHWRHVHEFRELFPSIPLDTQNNILKDDKIICCPGGSSVIELAAFLLEKKISHQQAIKGLSDMLVAGFPTPSDIYWSRSEFEKSPEKITQAMVIMRQHIMENLSADEIADLVGISRRQLDRIFQEHTGKSLSASYRDMKLTQARWLLERTDLSLERVARDSGFSDSSSFSRLFIKKTGRTPKKWRLDAKKD